MNGKGSNMLSTASLFTDGHWLGRVLSLWAWLSLVTLFAMLTHQSDTPILLGRYSTLVTITLAGLLSATLIGFFAERIMGTARLAQLSLILQARQTSTLWRISWLAIALIASYIIIGFFLSNFPAQYALLRAYLVLSTLLWSLAIGVGAHLHQHRIAVFSVIAGIAVITVGMMSVADIFPPLARTDEAFVFSMGRNFAETGIRSPIIYAPMVGDSAYLGTVWYRTFGAWLSVVGYSLYTGRLYMLLLGIITSALLAWGARRLTDNLTGLLVLLIGIFAFSQQIFIRYDMHAAFWGALSLMTYTYAREREGFAWHLAVGFFAGMMVDSSPGGYTFGAGLALIYALRYVEYIRQGRRLWLPFWGLALGGFIALVWFITSVQDDSLPGYEQSSILTSFLGQVIASLSPARLIEMSRQWLNAMLGTQSVLSILTILGLWGIWTYRKSTSIRAFERDWVILLVVWIALVITTYPYMPRYYLVFGLHVMVLIAAIGIRRILPPVGIALIVIWLCAHLMYGFINRGGESLENVVEAGELIAQILPRDAVVVAAEPYYFGMLDHPHFVGGAIEATMLAIRPGLTPDEVWQIVQPDAFVFSGNWPHEPARTASVEAYMQSYDFARAGCWLVQGYGQVELWAKPDVAPADDSLCLNIQVQ